MTDRRPDSLTQTDLDQFCGSEHYYQHFTGLRYTDGIQYMATQAGAFWLIDVIGSYQADPRVRLNQRLQEFQLWHLTVANNEGLVQLFEDSGLPQVLSQHVPFTDFPLDSIRLYVEGGILLLPSEH
jgi:hypothetical protein